ncbi:MAG: methyl-accepting chemotaxis protein [Christensenellaceae bacterium]
MNRMKKSVAAKISVMALIMIAAGTIVTGIYGYVSFRSEVIAANGEEALSIARSVADAIETDEMEAVMADGQPNEYWDSIKGYADEVKTDTGVIYLYAIDRSAAGEWRYFFDGAAPGDLAENLGELGGVESDDAFPEEAIEAYTTGEALVTDIYASEGYGIMLSGFAPIKNADGRTIGIVGADISVEEVNESAGRFGLFTILIVAGFSILAGLYFKSYVTKHVGRPVQSLVKASRKIAQGDMGVQLSYMSDDEIGQLTESFGNMVESTKEQTATLEQIADGNLAVQLDARGENDSMYLAFKKMVTQLSDMVEKIRQATDQVSTGTMQLADGATHLAQGSVEQSATVTQLSVSISNVADQTKESAGMARQAAELGERIQQNAYDGTARMDRLIEAVDEIGEASEKINKIIKTIDDIAFQTNILALNAAVEAARAGEAGKGFAVVADEVRNLASKSAEAASETGMLISDSIEKSQHGTMIAKETAAAFEKIVEGVEESSRLVSEIAQAAEGQQSTIEHINSGIDQVTQVVQQNSATAEESAASSEEISSQSAILKELVEIFKTKE